jgi:hypothetical protein
MQFPLFPENLFLFQANPLTGLISAFSTIFRLRTFPHLILPIIFETPLFQNPRIGRGTTETLSLILMINKVETKDGCNSKLNSKIIYFQRTAGEATASTLHREYKAHYNKRDGGSGGGERGPNVERLD